VRAITLIEALDHALPGFAAYVVSDENLFRPPRHRQQRVVCLFVLRRRTSGLRAVMEGDRRHRELVGPWK